MLSDLRIAQMYINKANNAVQRGIEFDLPFSSFRNLMRAKKCRYTGIVMTEKRLGAQSHLATDRTVDRIDSSKGYVVGNCVACCHAANNFKARFECGTELIDIPKAKRIIKFMEERRV